MANDVSKLPKWAQDQIRWRDNEIKRLRREIHQLIGGAADGCGGTNIAYRDGIRDDIPLPADKTISFYPSKKEGEFDRESRIDVRIERGGIYVSTQRRLIIQPEASNTCRIFNDEGY